MGTTWQISANVPARCVEVLGIDDDGQNISIVLEPDEARAFAASLTRKADRAETSEAR